MGAPAFGPRSSLFGHTGGEGEFHGPEPGGGCQRMRVMGGGDGGNRFGGWAGLALAGGGGSAVGGGGSEGRARVTLPLSEQSVHFLCFEPIEFFQGEHDGG